MERARAKKVKKPPRATELSRLKRDLQRVSKQLKSRDRELAEALEQQTTTGEILRVIASSATNLQSVLNTVAESAARLCEAEDARVRLIEGDGLRLVASFGPIPAPQGSVPINRGSPPGRAALDRQTIHVHDLAAEIDTEFPESKRYQPDIGARTFLATPLLREGRPIGVINIRRTVVRPFSEKHIALLKTFADQAVIAIENARLFQELVIRAADCYQ